MPADAELRLSRWAASRHGIVTVEDARACGVPERTFYRRGEQGLYERVHADVYRLTTLPLTPQGEVFAAVRAAGEGSVASHVTAAALWGLGDLQPVAPFHVTRVGRCQRQLDGVEVHQRPELDRRDRTTLGPLPITMVPRTIIDAAAMLALDDVEDLVVEAHRLARASVSGLTEALDRLPPNAPGTSKVRAILRLFDPVAAAQLMSRIESRGLGIFRRGGLPGPQVNRRLHAPDGSLVAKVDFDWDPPGVTAELDGLRFHWTRGHKVYDDRRQNALVLLGRLVLRYSVADLDEPERIIGEVRDAFTLRGATLV